MDTLLDLLEFVSYLLKLVGDWLIGVFLSWGFPVIVAQILIGILGGLLAVVVLRRFLYVDFSAAGEGGGGDGGGGDDGGMGDSGDGSHG